mmetsp:Transcript_7281/g.21452  ORF Transcript_7281/g.21452 Transcript_7281/m.21452 type:complete len:202 (-) Transcript_7281:83-688(-)|eukprot:CAMPEP_0206134942 /NCGR_PEP_ID=MMETSP1473-20131121/325_1 /ASSEMBLY_ACC=CAM_ASM_001109 /TAXON_ID=1461547 /ORGANISM="Stichococcus sp, Strain RCC1054" /LENGTH=201 /DNA_ID=CAMNT_0053526591 /DNA_START=180 /DNA_END=785 /DNA_ORIENTATION=-
MLRIFARRASLQVQQYAALRRGFATEVAKAPEQTNELDQSPVKSVPELKANGELDWDALNEYLDSESSRRELQALRSTYLDICAKAEEADRDEKVIDWAYWKKQVDPQLVSEFEKALNTMPIPEFKDDSGEQDAEFEKLHAEAKEMAKHAEQRLKEIRQEIKQTKAEMAKIATLTVDDVLESDPELREKLQAEIAAGKWIS